jgi:hypothetical protein
MIFDIKRSQKICEHVCAPFSEVTDEHVALAMGEYWQALVRIEELENAVILERAKSRTGRMFWDQCPPGYKARYLTDAEKQLQSEGILP